MNQELMNMAEKVINSIPDQVDFDIPDLFIEMFAALVAEAEREKFCAVLRQLHDSYSLASRSNNIRARGETK